MSQVQILKMFNKGNIQVFATQLIWNEMTNQSKRSHPIAMLWAKKYDVVLFRKKKEKEINGKEGI